MRFASLVPLLQVQSVNRSIAFYESLGFKVENTHPEDEPQWAWLVNGNTQLMLGHRQKDEARAALFYLYCDDVSATREELVAKGLPVGPIERPFWAPGGEFRLEDPDGHVLMITHT